VQIRLNEEQELFAAAVAELAHELTDDWALGRGPDTVAAPRPSERAWRMIAETGLLSLRLEESAGGSSASCLDVCVAVEQLGRFCVPAPVVGTLLLVEQLRLAGADGDLVAALGGGHRQAAPTLRRDLSGFATDPADAVAWDCAGAATAVCLVGASGRPAEPRAAEYPVTARRAVDLTRSFGDLDLAAGPSGTIALAPPSADGPDRLTGFALSVLAADLLGVMQTALDVSVEYARSRHQFGAPIGSFQAIQHLVAECLVSVEATRSAVWYAAWAADELPATEAVIAARAAKAFASTSAVAVAEAAVQVHGGMGMTWEARPHVWLRRARTGRKLFGDEHTQYELIARHQFGRSDANAGRG
jgi:alkylation response protein AidB-like acyl-CoA dehydrogenase